jgi:MFS family permease
MSHRLDTPGWRSVSAHLHCIQPLYGRISDLGRKVGEFDLRKKATTYFALVSSILLFALGSLLCGAARVHNFPDDFPFVVMF